MQNSSLPEILRLLWDIIVFRLVAYLFSYEFVTVLYQFLETGTSERCLICIVQPPDILRFHLIPLSFFFYSPFKSTSWWAPVYQNQI